GIAPYFREHLRLWMKDWCEKHRKPDGSKYNLYRDGLKIYTTLDSRLQQYAEEAQREHLSEIQKHFFDYWKGKDPWKDFPTEWNAIYRTHPLYKEMKAEGKSDAEIDRAMKTPAMRKIFTYEGEKDTLISIY